MFVVTVNRMLSIRNWSVEGSTDLPRARRPSCIVFTRNLLIVQKMLKVVLRTEHPASWQWFAEQERWSSEEDYAVVK